MPNPITLPVGPGVTFRVGSTRYKVSDHNRRDISITKDRIENKKRMANGTLRTFVVTTKRVFKTSWELLPRDDSYTCDGFWGAKSIKEFYDANQGSFDLVITYGDSTEEIVTVMFSEFSLRLMKRNRYNDFYDVDISMEEV